MQIADTEMKQDLVSRLAPSRKIFRGSPHLGISRYIVTHKDNRTSVDLYDLCYIAYLEKDKNFLSNLLKKANVKSVKYIECKDGGKVMVAKSATGWGFHIRIIPPKDHPVQDMFWFGISEDKLPESMINKLRKGRVYGFNPIHFIGYTKIYEYSGLTSKEIYRNIFVNEHVKGVEDYTFKCIDCSGGGRILIYISECGKYYVVDRLDHYHTCQERKNMGRKYYKRVYEGKSDCKSSNTFKNNPCKCHENECKLLVEKKSYDKAKLFLDSFLRFSDSGFYDTFMSILGSIKPNEQYGDFKISEKHKVCIDKFSHNGGYKITVYKKANAGEMTKPDKEFNICAYRLDYRTHDISSVPFYLVRRLLDGYLYENGNSGCDQYVDNRCVKKNVYALTFKNSSDPVFNEARNKLKDIVMQQNARFLKFSDNPKNNKFIIIGRDYVGSSELSVLRFEDHKTYYVSIQDDGKFKVKRYGPYDPCIGY